MIGQCINCGQVHRNEIEQDRCDRAAAARSREVALQLATMSRPRVVALAAMLGLGIAGCSTTGARDRALIAAGQAAATLPAMSDSELTCTAEPHAPAPKAGSGRVRESQVTDYILDLREAGADCRDKLGVTRRVWRKVEEVKSRAVPPADKGESK